MLLYRGKLCIAQKKEKKLGEVRMASIGPSFFPPPPPPALWFLHFYAIGVSLIGEIKKAMYPITFLVLFFPPM